MDERDEDLIAAYIAGDEDAFATLTARHIKGVYSFAYRLIGDTHAAEDVTQETFVKIWKSLKSYNQGTSKFKTWMLHIARNTAIDFLRKRKHVPLSQFDDEEGHNSITDTSADEEKLPDELFAEGEDIQMLAEATSKLPTKQQEVLILHYTNGLTFEEISEVLREPHNTVKSRHHRALLALRKLIPKDAPNLIQ